MITHRVAIGFPAFRSRRSCLVGLRIGQVLSAPFLFLWIIGSLSAEPLWAQPTMVVPCTIAADCLREAVRSLDQRDPETATRLLENIIRRFPGTPWEGRAALLLGRYYQEQGDRRAVPYLLSVPRQSPLLGDYAQYYLGEALSKSNDLNGAATAFDVLLQQYPDSMLRPQALHRAVEVWFQAEDCVRARERVFRFLADYSSHSLVPAVLLRQGDCQQKAREIPAAIVTYRRIWTQYAASPQAGEAASRLQRLKEEGAAIPELVGNDWWLRAKALFEAGQYAPAVMALEEVLRFSQGVPDRDQARLKLGIAHVRLKHYHEARAALAELIRMRTGPIAQEAVVWLARVLLRQGQDDQLLALAREVEAGLLSGDLKMRFLLLLAAQHADRGRFDKAVHAYRQVGEAAGQEGLAAEALWQAGWLLYKTGQYDEASRSFDHALRVQPGGPFASAALYWKARSLEKLGEPQRATAVAQVLCGNAPHSYYCQTARLRASWAVGEALNGASEDVAIQVPDPHAEAVVEDVHYQRAIELRMVGWLRQAGEELATLTGRMQGGRGGTLWLAGMLETAGDYHRALTLTKLFFPDVIERGGAGVPQTFWQLAYPSGYLPLIKGVTNAQRADAYLIAAVIREESVYNPEAISSAGALGLMQILPQTGQQIASRLGLEGFSRERLFEPCYNIRLGSSYLGQLAEKFDGDLIRMLAAYNAGPEAVSRWVQEFGGVDTDEFIESIPYSETRSYDKKVIRSYREYRRIYGDERKGHVLDKAC